MTFKIIPAIDIIDGQLVRLYKGQYDQKTIYPQSPLEMAKFYESLGFHHIHIVDLNGAVDGKLTNLDVISNIVHETNLSVQVGGGVRSFSHLEALFSNGISAVIVGSLFVSDFELVSKMIHAFPNQIIAGLDILNFQVAAHGWTKTSNISLHSMLDRLHDLPIHSILTTDIEKDGTFEGPNIELYKEMTRLTKHAVVASGGVSTIDDLIGLKNLSLESLVGCVVGKAIIEGRIRPNDLEGFL